MTNELKNELQERIDELKAGIDSDVIDLAFDYDLDDINYVNDTISEWADSNVNIYYYDLKKSLENGEIVDAMEDAVNEGFIDFKNYDFYKHIQAGQYLYYERKCYDYIEDISKIWARIMIIKTLMKLAKK